MKNKKFARIFAFGISIYIVIVVVFGFIYFFTESISFSGQSPIPVGKFGDCIYFSFVSFLTIGYGDIAPNGACGKWELFIESIFSIGFNAIFAGYLAFLFLRRSNNILISDKIFVRKSKKQGITTDLNFDFIIRIGNKGNQVIDCKGVLEFFVFTNNTRTTILKFDRDYRVLDKTWNFKMRLVEPGNEISHPINFKSTLLRFFLGM